MKCADPNCKREARFCPLVKIYPQSELRGVESNDRPMEMVIGLVLCREHIEALKPDEFMGDDFKAQLSAVMTRDSKALPDFTRTEVDKVLLTDPRVAMLTNAFEERLKAEGAAV